MLPLAADTALPVAPSHLEVTVDAVTPLAHPAVIIHPLVTVAAMNRPHRPATVSVPPYAVAAAVAVAEEVVVVAAAAAEVVSHITVVAAAVVAAVVTGPLHRDAPLPRLTSTRHHVAVAAVAMVGAMTIPRPDVAAGTRTTRTRVPTAVGLVAGGITMNPIEGVR